MIGAIGDFVFGFLEQLPWWDTFEAWGDKKLFRWKVRRGLYRHLAVQISNGVTDINALSVFRARLQRNKQTSADKIVANAYRLMHDGASLADAFQDWIPLDEVSIIRAGESSGQVSDALMLLVETKDMSRKIMKTIVSSMIPSFIQFLMAYGLAWWIARYVVPDLQMILPASKVTGSVLFLYRAGDVANSWISFLFPAIGIILAICIAHTLPRWTGPSRVKAENYFPYSFYRDIHGYTWIMGFLALMRAGMADVDILRLQARDANPWLKERLQKIQQRMEINGMTLSRALLADERNGTAAFAFPNPDLIDEISSMEPFPDFPVKMGNVCKDWIGRVQEAMVDKSVSIGFFMQFVMYVVLTYLVYAINEMSAMLANPGI